MARLIASKIRAKDNVLSEQQMKERVKQRRKGRQAANVSDFVTELLLQDQEYREQLQQRLKQVTPLNIYLLCTD